jgi:hypothetical protein
MVLAHFEKVNKRINFYSPFQCEEWCRLQSLTSLATSGAMEDGGGVGTLPS